MKSEDDLPQSQPMAVTEYDPWAEIMNDTMCISRVLSLFLSYDSVLMFQTLVNVTYYILT